MQMQSRRALLKNAVVAGAAVAGAAVSIRPVEAKASDKLEKKSYPANTNADNAAAAPPLFSSAVSFGNLLFLSGVVRTSKGPSRSTPSTS